MWRPEFLEFREVLWPINHQNELQNYEPLKHGFRDMHFDNVYILNKS